MAYEYDQRKRPQGRQTTAPEPETAPGPEFRALMTGASRPTAAQKGRSIDLDAAIKAKMEHAFGDLSAVKLYESRAVGEAGAEAIAQGNEIAFAPGMTDFSTRSGQERLGHELSHVMSQRSGAVRGQGFLANSALEARADREGAMAAAGEQIYAGPVTHTLSAASPSPAAAGPMQAKRSWFGGKKKKSSPRKMITNDDDIFLPQSDDLPEDEKPLSQYADDFRYLESQKGTKEERKAVYNKMAIPTAQNMTNDQRNAVYQYIAGSSGPNSYLREQKDHLFYPQTEESIQRTQKQVDAISQAIQRNPLPEQLTTYRGTTDKFFSTLLQQNGLGDAVNKDGSVNHAWLKKNQKALRKNLVGKTFHEKAFTSTSTEKSFAQKWSQQKTFEEKNFEYGMTGKTNLSRELQKRYKEHPEKLPGAHLLTMNLPKGSKGAFVDRVTDNTERPQDQREVLLDKGSTFKISDIRKMKDSDSYELVMDLLAEEEGVKKDSAPQETGGVRPATKADLDALFNADDPNESKLDPDMVVELPVPGKKKKKKKK